MHPTTEGGTLDRRWDVRVVQRLILPAAVDGPPSNPVSERPACFFARYYFCSTMQVVQNNRLLSMRLLFVFLFGVVLAPHRPRAGAGARAGVTIRHLLKLLRKIVEGTPERE